MSTVQLASLIEKSHIKACDYSGGLELEAFGVSNTDGITRTAHRKSEDLSNYLVIEPASFAYNPYRINVGSIGLTPEAVFGLVSPAYVVFRVKKGRVIPEVLLDFLKSSEGLRQINALARGAVRKALRFEDICEIEFPDLSHERQLEILSHKQGFNVKHSKLLSEIAHQEDLVARLKQAILQEAITGRLTAGWRAAQTKVEPASQLLARIRAEKARLVAAKKLRPEKPLPPIPDSEIPFALPAGWAWCRLGDASRLISGASFESADFRKSEGVRCIKITNAGVDEFIETDDSLPSEFSISYSKNRVSTGDLILALTRPYIAAGLKICRCPPSYDGALLNQRVAGIRPQNELLDSDYAYLFMRSDLVLKGYQAEFDSKGQQPNLKNEHVTHLPIPLPPLREQTEIVARVEGLMERCRELEAEIERSRAHAAALLQAVLREAFAPATVAA